VDGALAWLGSSCESPPPGVFVQDLFKPSIRLEEDIPARAPRGSPDEGGPVSVPGPLLGEGGPSPMSGASPRAPVRPTTLDSGQAKVLVVVVGPACL
jgi:hypothetical protein